MNRRALARVSVAVLTIVAGAWWLSLEVAAALPAPAVAAPVVPPEAVVVAALPVAGPSDPPVDAAVAGEPVDAGRLAEVEIEVFEDGVRQVGSRVELEGPAGRSEGRPLDIMGIARFTLVEGLWRITSPDRRNVVIPPYDGGSRDDWAHEAQLAYTTPLEVRAPLTRFRLELPRVHLVRGRVLSVKGEPVVGAQVALVRSERFGWAVRTDWGGAFKFETEAGPVTLYARLGTSRSVPRALTAPGEQDLVLEPWTWLRVNLIGPGSGPACVRVQHRGDFVTEATSAFPIEVPVGHLELLTRRLVRGRLFSARGEADVLDDGADVDLYFKPSQPIRGRLLDASGRAVAGVDVRITEVDVTKPTDGGVTWNNSTTSNSVGQFSFSPASLDCADPVYQLAVALPWRTTRQVLVRLDDAPLEVMIEPAGQ